MPRRQPPAASTTLLLWSQPSWPPSPCTLQDLTVLLHALSSHAEAPLCLDLSGCGGLGDGALQQLAREVRLAGLRELRLAGSSRLSAAALAQLGSALLAADAPLLQGLELLDTSHVQSLGRGGAGPHGGAPAADGGDAGSPATQALLALLQAAGGSLRRAVLDGCYLGGGLLPRLVGWCSGLQGLSLVGCSGVGDADLAALTALSTLRDLAVGGSSLAWHEHRALTGKRPLLPCLRWCPAVSALSRRGRGSSKCDRALPAALLARRPDRPHPAAHRAAPIPHGCPAGAPAGGKQQQPAATGAGGLCRPQRRRAAAPAAEAGRGRGIATVWAEEWR